MATTAQGRENASRRGLAKERLSDVCAVPRAAELGVATCRARRCDPSSVKPIASMCASMCSAWPSNSGWTRTRERRLDHRAAKEHARFGEGELVCL